MVGNKDDETKYGYYLSCHILSFHFNSLSRVHFITSTISCVDEAHRLITNHLSKAKNPFDLIKYWLGVAPSPSILILANKSLAQRLCDLMKFL